MPPERAPSAALREVGGAIDAHLLDAIIAGLLRHPQQISQHAEALAGLNVANDRSSALLSRMIDAALMHQGLDSEGMLTILGTSPEYNRAIELLRADGMHFSFTRPTKSGAPDERDVVASDAIVLRDLDEAIAAIVAWPEVERALAAATNAARIALDETSFAEQQRLVRTRADLANRLAQLADSGRAG